MEVAGVRIQPGPQPALVLRRHADRRAALRTGGRLHHRCRTGRPDLPPGRLGHHVRHAALGRAVPADGGAHGDGPARGIAPAHGVLPLRRDHAFGGAPGQRVARPRARRSPATTRARITPTSRASCASQRRPPKPRATRRGSPSFGRGTRSSSRRPHPPAAGTSRRGVWDVATSHDGGDLHRGGGVPAGHAHAARGPARPGRRGAARDLPEDAPDPGVRRQRQGPLEAELHLRAGSFLRLRRGDRRRRLRGPPARRPDHEHAPRPRSHDRQGRRPQADDGRAHGQGRRLLRRQGRLDAHRCRGHGDARCDRDRRQRDADRGRRRPHGQDARQATP